MKQQSRRKQASDDAGPIHLIVEGIELAAVLEGVEDEGNQAENVEMNGTRRVPAAHENEKSDEEVQKADEAAVIFDGIGFFRWSGDDGSFKLAAIARQFVADLSPKPGVPEAAGDLHLRVNGNVVNGDQEVAGANTGLRGGGIGRQLPGLDAGCGVQPSYPVIGGLKTLALDKVQPGKNHRR